MSEARLAAWDASAQQAAPGATPRHAVAFFEGFDAGAEHGIRWLAGFVGRASQADGWVRLYQQSDHPAEEPSA